MVKAERLWLTPVFQLQHHFGLHVGYHHHCKISKDVSRRSRTRTWQNVDGNHPPGFLPAFWLISRPMNSSSVIICHLVKPKAMDHRFIHDGLPPGKLTQLWKITIFYGKIQYKWPFSIAMLVYHRVLTSDEFLPQLIIGRIPQWEHMEESSQRP